MFDTCEDDVMSKSNCFGYDPELWFSSDKEKQEIAREICDDCLVRELCLTRCMEFEELSQLPRHGIFGGLDPNERINLRRRSNRKKAKA